MVAGGRGSRILTYAMTVPSRNTPEPDETLIAPPSRWPGTGLAELWAYRELLAFLAWRDIKVRYQQTLLGAAWAVFQPALMMAVFWLFLSRVAGVPAGEVPYPLFVFAGLLPWYFFANAVGGAANSVVDAERLVSKVYFPRLVIPFAATGPALLDLIVASTLLGVLLAVYGQAPAATAPLAVFAVVVLGVAALGIGAGLAALNVSYRDFRYVVPFLMQAWMFATPSIYLDVRGGESAADPLVRAVLAVNPVTGLVEFFRAALFGFPLPWEAFGVSTAVAAAAFVLGCGYFRWVEHRFADVI